MDELLSLIALCISSFSLGFAARGILCRHEQSRAALSAVEAAYHEGWADGWGMGDESGESADSYFIEKDWRASKALVRLSPDLEEPK